MTLSIHPDLQSFIPPLTAEEFGQLEANLLQDGCRDPLTIWQEEQVILDGHNRHEICTRHDIPYTMVEISLPDVAAAQAWMVANQLGRRNLTPEQVSSSAESNMNYKRRAVVAVVTEEVLKQKNKRFKMRTL
jgi:hypothetical protein